jgi:hypothetical protein
MCSEFVQTERALILILIVLHMALTPIFINSKNGKGFNSWNEIGGVGNENSNAALNTFWNLKSDAELYFPGSALWSQVVNAVGCNSSSSEIKDKIGKWFEPINTKLFSPSNIYEAQLSMRKFVLDK